MHDGSPVATAPEQVLGDLAEVAARVRKNLEAELSESAEAPAGDAAPAAEISNFAHEERARVLEAGVTGLEKLAAGRPDEVGDDEYFGVEAIVLLEGRPAVLVQGGDFAAQEGEWALLDAHRDGIRASLARVGRVEVRGHPRLDWVGTAFLVGPDTVLTNRHVAVEFARSDGAGWTFQQGMTAQMDPGEELPLTPADARIDLLTYEVAEVVGVHADVDLAVLRVAPPNGGGPLPSPLAVAADAPADVPGHLVYVVGYPAWDGRRNEPESMRRIFMDVYNVKRLQPGRATRFAPGELVMGHDCSTLGGNSGSPVFGLPDHRVLALHFGGRYRTGNVSVPLWELVDDPLLARAGINWV
ncbi:trypsin-like serine peptidase [Streptomyces sp. NPDC048604]|uniref:trypsin-like serine peptidase n=1 Tax=Streptomyces sp. NPDC048604 TaxID=3365578 RepID=UPI00371492CF